MNNPYIKLLLAFSSRPLVPSLSTSRESCFAICTPAIVASLTTELALEKRIPC